MFAWQRQLWSWYIILWVHCYLFHQYLALINFNPKHKFRARNSSDILSKYPWLQQPGQVFMIITLLSSLSHNSDSHPDWWGHIPSDTSHSASQPRCCTKQDGAWQSKLCTLWWDKTQFTCWQYRLLHPLSKPRLRHSKSASDLRCWVQIGREEGGWRML